MINYEYAITIMKIFSRDYTRQTSAFAQAYTAGPAPTAVSTVYVEGNVGALAVIVRLNVSPFLTGQASPSPQKSITKGASIRRPEASAYATPMLLFVGMSSFAVPDIVNVAF